MMSGGQDRGLAWWRPDDGLRMQHLRRAFALPVMGMLLLATTLAVVRLPERGPDPLGLLCLVGYGLATAWSLARRLTPWLAAWTTGAGLTASGLPLSPEGLAEPLCWMGPGVAIAILVVVLRPVPAAVAGLTSITLTSWVRLDAGMSLLDVLNIGVVHAAFLLSGVLFFAAIVGHARQADRVAEHHHRRVLQTARETSLREATARARWTLHDEIISALRAVATADDLDVVRSACDRAASAARVFEATEPSDDAVDLGTAIAAGVPLRVHVVEADLPRAGDLPPQVARDLVAAAREALRNVERHAGVDAAEVSVRGLDPGLEIAVTDHGHGFSLGQRAGFGINSSIRERVTLHGASCEVASSPGSGTRVRLRWRPVVEPDVADTVDTAGESRPSFDPMAAAGRPGGWLIAPLCVAQGVNAISYSQGSPDRAALMGLLVALEVVAIAAMWRFSRATPRLLEQAIWSVGLSVAILGGLQLAPPGALTNAASWMIPLAQLPLTLLAFYAPRSLPLLTVPPLLAVSLAILLDPASPLGQSTLALNAVVMPALIGAWCGTRMHKYAALAARTAAETAETDARAAELAAADEASSRQLRRTRAVTVPWLQAVAQSGEIPDESTRAMARVLAAESRDELDSPGAYTFRVAQPLADLRTRGGVVHLRGDFGPQHRRRADAVLPQLFARLDAGHQVTVTARPGELRIAVVPGLEPPMPDFTGARGFAWQIESDADLTVISAGVDHPPNEG